MKTFRVGSYSSLIIDYGYVIQEKKWWGWKTRWFYDYKENAIRDAKKLKKHGHTIYFYI